MPALFSFLGGMASGYNAKKAAEADLAAKKELAADKASARMDSATYELGEKRKTEGLVASIDAIGEALKGYLTDGQRQELMDELKDKFVQLGIPPSDAETAVRQTVEGSQSTPDPTKSTVGEVVSKAPVPTSGPRTTINNSAS